MRGGSDDGALKTLSFSARAPGPIGALDSIHAPALSGKRTHDKPKRGRPDPRQGCIKLKLDSFRERGGDSLSPQSLTRNAGDKLSPPRLSELDLRKKGLESERLTGRARPHFAKCALGTEAIEGTVFLWLD